MQPNNIYISFTKLFLLLCLGEKLEDLKAAKKKIVSVQFFSFMYLLLTQGEFRESVTVLFLKLKVKISSSLH